MSSLSINDIIRAAHVNRWQIVRTLREQNVAEHQYMVTMIAQEIAEKVIGDEFTDESRLLLINWAMRHDLVEVYTGDISTPVKQRLKKAIGEGGNDPFEVIEREICEKCHQAKVDAGQLLMCIVKMADLIDGIRFMKLEGHGEHANHVLTKITKMFDIYVTGCIEKWPHWNWEGAYLVCNEIIEEECGYLKFEGVL